ncbi:lytic transglycosylase domain-containing protein [Sulfurivermis fontis]|uniref:lytic transglycosylase domain-containing protein n=1 Tax=Sulfurivermis fontis TaxID=1972068 RepID=UPI001E3FFD85|nr:lytic transglycosylase domain-containing protein [Sulfurivermis fontis]
MKAVLVATALVVFVPAANAAYDQCFAEAAQRYGVAQELLRAIAAQESGLDTAAEGRNADGSRDIGVMQINTWWLPLLERYGIHEEHLWEPCLNVHVGAWILAGNIARYGYTWDAVGAYNAGTAKSKEAKRRRENYAHKVAGQLVLHRARDGLRGTAQQSR